MNVTVTIGSAVLPLWLVMTKIRILLQLVLVSVLLMGCTPTTKPKTVTIAISSNMQFSMEEITSLFTKSSKIRCNLVISSSGKLTSQITEGAPYDVFLSADMRYPQQLHDNGLSIIPPRVYAYGKLVLWTAKNDLVPSLQELTNETIGHIALANPKTAPYGSAAVEVLKQHGIYDQVLPKLVFGESISQTNQFILSRAAPIGFTAKSVVLSSNLREKGNWLELNPSNYSPIQQGIILLNNDKEAKAFYDFIFSEEAKKILKNYGYSIDE